MTGLVERVMHAIADASPRPPFGGLATREMARAAIDAVHQEVSGLIQTGDLGGNGCDKNAERNGIVLVANVLFSAMHTE